MSIKSGHSYSLSQLFSGSRRIIIPDLQRDYCWGDPKQALAANFLDSLLEMFVEAQDHSRPVSLGLLYAYANPSNFINIADGQQRLTTIYLLLCVIYYRLDDHDPSIKQEIADFLALDAAIKRKEPRLCYEVRESTVYFMKAFLNCEVFNPDSDGPLEEQHIKEATWFRKEYETDPSIMSMLQSIEAFYKHRGLREAGQSTSDFARFLLGGNAGGSGIRFIYFDVKKRDLGEKMYVIINTCGAPMEINEHIKPLLIGRLSDFDKKKMWAVQWEIWQDFFWVNRKENEESADECFNDFISWYVKIRKQSKYERGGEYSYFVQQIKGNAETVLTDLERFYIQVSALWNRLKTSEYQLIFEQISKGVTTMRDLNSHAIELVTLPLLALMVRFPDEHHWHALFLRRLRKNYFLKTRSPEDKRGVDWLHLLQMIERIPESGSWLEDIHRFANFTDLKGLDDNANNNWFDEEEKIKDVLFPERHHLSKGKESSLWQWEDHDDFAGDITSLLQMCQITDDTNILPELKRQYFEKWHQQELLAKLNKYYNSYLFLHRLMNGEDVAESIDISRFNMANHYRLYRLLIGCQTIDHIPSTQFNGVAFSPKDNLVHLHKVEFLRLCRDGENRLLDYSRAKIREVLPDLIPLKKESLNTEKILKLWFILKVLRAESEKVLLTYLDKHGYAAYGEASLDLIFPDHGSDIKTANLMCGFAKKAGGGYESSVLYSECDDPSKLHTPLIKIKERLFNLCKMPDFSETDKKDLCQQLDVGEKVLSELLRPYTSEIR